MYFITDHSSYCNIHAQTLVVPMRPIFFLCYIVSFPMQIVVSFVFLLSKQRQHTFFIFCCRLQITPSKADDTQPLAYSRQELLG